VENKIMELQAVREEYLTRREEFGELDNWSDKDAVDAIASDTRAAYDYIGSLSRLV
jgi:hypothetical protein